VKSVSQPSTGLREDGGEGMTPLFEHAPRQRMDRPKVAFVLAKAVAANLAGTAGCAALAFLYFGVAFATEGGPAPPGVAAELWLIVAAVAMLGALLAGVARHFPWPVAFLTPLFLGILGSPSCPDCFWAFCKLGGMASVVFLIGAFAARGVKRWIHARRQV
jgi:hypothetical protein